MTVDELEKESQNLQILIVLDKKARKIANKTEEKLFFCSSRVTHIIF